MGGRIIKAGFRGSVGSFSLDAAFETPARGVTALFGPSGCGKTTVLRCIAGLNRLRQGYCAIDGEIWQDASSFLPTHKRPIGYVFQEASLFPHLCVRRNLLYGAGGPRRAGQSDAIRFDEVVDLLGLAALLDRAPRHLSGGERQRVAIGRALLSQPSLMLMDEPLSALDRQAKDEILPFLERLHESLSLPVIYVAHDMDEIERLADHLVLMDAGRVVAAGPLAALQSDPNLPLAKTRSAAVSLDAVVESFDARLWRRHARRLRRALSCSGVPRRPRRIAQNSHPRERREPRPRGGTAQHDPQCSAVPHLNGHALGRA